VVFDLADATRLHRSLLFRGAHNGIWRTDHSPAGAHRVIGFGDTQCCKPRLLARVGGNVFFYASSGIWKTDGSTAGTKRIGNVYPGDYLTRVGRTLVFDGSTLARGDELWESDGTSRGTRLVADIHPGPGDSRPSGLASVGDRIMFLADDGVHHRQLWTAKP